MTYDRNKLVVSKAYIDWVREHRPERFSEEEWEEWIDKTFLELQLIPDDIPTRFIVKRGYW